MGVFANALGMGQNHAFKIPEVRTGLATWLMDRFHHRASAERRLALVDRISLAPRQTVALIEADGQRLLVATAPDGAPVFYPLPSASGRKTATRSRKAANS